MTKDKDNGKANAKWIRLGKAVAALAVAVGALATSITGLVKSDDAQDKVQDVGTLAVDLATSTDTDAAYEALLERSRFLERQVEALQRRVDDLQRDQARVAWGVHAVGPPAPAHLVAAGEGEGEPELADVVPTKPDRPKARKPPRKLADLPAVKASRAKRAGKVRQVQEQLQIQAPLPMGD